MDRFIIFTNHYTISPHDEDIFPLFNATHYGTAANRCAVVGFDKQYPIGNVPEPVRFLDQLQHYDLLLLSDVEWTAVELHGIIKAFVGNDNDLFVVLHENPQNHNLKEGHKAAVEAALNNPGFINFICQSHVEGDMYYVELSKLAHAISDRDSQVYSNALDDIKKRFSDLTLEAKLELLHMCLTPEGASKVLKGEFPVELQQEKEKFWRQQLVKLNAQLTRDEKYKGKPYVRSMSTDDELKGKNTEWNVEDLVRALAKQSSSQDKVIEFDSCFHPEYIIALSALRDTLLN